MGGHLSTQSWAVPAFVLLSASGRRHDAVTFAGRFYFQASAYSLRCTSQDDAVHSHCIPPASYSSLRRLFACVVRSLSHIHDTIHEASQVIIKNITHREDKAVPGLDSSLQSFSTPFLLFCEASEPKKQTAAVPPPPHCARVVTISH